MKKSTLYILLGMFLLVVLVAFLRQKEANRGYIEQPYTKEKILFDTLVSIKAYGKDKTGVEEAVDEALKEMARVDRELNYYNSTSSVSLLNRMAGKKEVTVSSSLLYLTKLSLAYGQKTGGAFNPALGPVVDLYSFGRDKHVPSQGELNQTLPLTNISLIEVNQAKKTVKLKEPKMKLDLGGVGKGLAVDEAIGVLRKYHIKKALVTTGSTTTVLGNKPDGKKWQIGITHPRQKGKIIGVLCLKDRSVSTSGDYQQYFIRNKKRYHHILNPQTGLPASGVISVTVVTTKSCAEADTLSTAVFVMGPSDGMKFIESQKSLEGVIVKSNGQVLVSRGLKGKVKDLLEKIAVDE